MSPTQPTLQVSARSFSNNLRSDGRSNSSDLIDLQRLLDAGVVSAFDDISLTEIDSSADLAAYLSADGSIAPAPSGGGGTPAVSNIYGCPSYVQVGDAVYQSAADFVDQAIASSVNMTAIGVVRSKPTGTTCSLTYRGEQTGFAGLVPGDVYYLSPTVPGGITNVAPTQQGQILFTLGIAKDSTTLRVVMIDQPVVL